LRPGECGRVWVGAEVEAFRAVADRVEQAHDRVESHRVLFYGQFIPLHGLETIIAAARLLRDEPIEWILIGRGQDEGLIRRQLQEQTLPRLRWIEWVDYFDLKDWIQRADVCLGIFGTSEKAASVIPNKVFQTVVAGRPLITRDSPAVRELLSPSAPCVYLVPAGNPEALAQAVRQQRKDHCCAGRPVECHAGISGRIDKTAIGRQFLEVVSSLRQRRIDAQA
jgi:glycosyltransferase involved in cell wall biosynthesis